MADSPAGTIRRGQHGDHHGHDFSGCDGHDHHGHDHHGHDHDGHDHDGHDRGVNGVSSRPRWRAAFSAFIALLAFFAIAAALSSGLGLVDMAEWAARQQRTFHTLVGQLLALDGGSAGAVLALLGACLLYGFLHAAVPGHGKFVIAGAGLGSRVSAARLVALSLAAALAQALTAIALVYGSFSFLDITAGWAMTATDAVLVPLSYVAIIVIAVVLIRRAFAGLSRAIHGEPAAGCGHKHGPSAADVAQLTSWRDAAVLILGIGLRPCTGAVFVLVAAWRLDLLAVGAAAAVAMALGTGSFISLVAVSAVGARGATLFAAGHRRVRLVVPVLQLLAGVAIFLVAAAFLVSSVV